MNARPLLLACAVLMGSSLCTLPCEAAQKRKRSAEPAVERPVVQVPAEQESPAPPPGMPEWITEDQSRMFRGEWFAGEEILPDESEKIDLADEAFSLDAPDESVSPAEQSGEIPKELMPLYLPQKADQQLMDPQLLLSEQEQADIAKLLEEIREVTGITVYLTVFNHGQKVPPSLNAPSLARHIFGGRPSCVLVEYYRGSLSPVQVVYSEDLGHCLDAQKRKELLDAAQKQAAEYADDLDILWHFLNAQGNQFPGILNLSRSTPMATHIDVPKIDYKFRETPASPKKAPAKIDYAEKAQETWDHYGTTFLILFSLLIVSTGAYLLWQRKRIHPLISQPVRKRMGAPHGTGTTRVLHYSGQVSKSKLEKDLLKDFFN